MGSNQNRNLSSGALVLEHRRKQANRTEDDDPSSVAALRRVDEYE
jgi:hypothetical protein